jgi:hypothetical protein
MGKRVCDAEFSKNLLRLTVQDRTGTRIHSAMVCATGRVVVFKSCAHLVSKYEVVYASDCLARMSDDRIQYLNRSTIS